MARVSGSLKSSVNAGQLSKSLLGKVNLKQYYSGAKRMLGFEPIAQSGFKLLPGSRYVGAGVSANCNKCVLAISNSLSYTLVVTAGRIDIWRNDRVLVATVTGGAVAGITSGMVPDLRFYGEANTVGIWHPDLWQAVRLVRNPANDAIWNASTWPYGDLPEVDLGGVYPTVADKWTIFIRYTAATINLVMSLSIDGNNTSAVQLKDGSGTNINPNAATNPDWDLFAGALQTAARALPGMNAGLTIVNDHAASYSLYRVLVVTFDGTLKGDEYQFDARVTNTSDASALTSHTQVGKTDGEPLISASRGGFSGMSLFQDRACYFGPKARSAAVAMSRIAEYFDLNIEAQQDNAARLDALRTDTSEQILYLMDATYLLAFTDKGVYFASNRTIERNKPLNWVNAIEVGIKRNCPPVKLEGKVYFVSAEGGQLYSIDYDAVTEKFAPEPENDLNGSDPEDLVRDIKTIAVQHKTGKMTSNRLWVLRDDGRLVLCVINKKQEIMAACEWPIADGGQVCSLAVDGQEQVWLTIDRNGTIVEEVLEEEDVNLFQMAFSVVTDLTGQASGLATLNGKTVWALIDNDVHGPFTVSAGAVQTEIPSRPAKIGIWAPPIYESMPYVRVLPNDEVVRRPGKVGSARLFIENTASIAIGANGRAPRDVSLSLAGDDLSQPKKNYSGHTTVTGLIGACMDPTLTISQVRPGQIRVRDYIPGVKL
ncbi:hypothetical protein PWG15_05450 [Ensifer adhaerens]|uniref:hypothetical protein n=1 Tax=Ensifer adhaerens TaxID=106592 RepID=UPI0023A997F2|nr:hypothetical protein [Ensifer adhaerens]WDZ77950.1 hypothetical protein PWG15_05450 [Ensifer adhaerens]